MIDWILTKKRFNRTTLDGRRPKVVCRCDKCNKIKEITIRVKKRVIDNQLAWECPKCVSNRAEVKQKLSDIRNNKLRPSDTPYRRWYLSHKNEILEKNRLRRRKSQKICPDCNRMLLIDCFYHNNTYIAKYCLKCEAAYKLKRDREVSLYRQKWSALHNQKPRKPYKATTVAKCLKENFNNVHFPNLKRCAEYNIVPEMVQDDYRLLLNSYIAEHGLICHYCKKSIFAFCFEHMTPLSRNGRHHKDNVTISCVDCNQSKHNLTLLEFIAKQNGQTICEPSPITRTELFVDSTNIPDSWKYPIWSQYELEKDLDRLLNYKPTGKLSQTISASYAYKIIKHFHTSFWHSTVESCTPITEAFNDHNIITKCLTHIADNRRISYRRLLREIAFRTRYKYPSIFAPHLAVELINKYVKTNDVVYDPCAGWGSRWLASVNRHWQYYCSEPNKLIKEENENIAAHFNLPINIDSRAIGEGKLNIKPDLFFTSPPWGNTEIYFGGDKVPIDLLDKLYNDIRSCLKPNGIAALHLPEKPKNWPEPTETLAVSSRGRYSSSSIQKIFVWSHHDLSKRFIP